MNRNILALTALLLGATVLAPWSEVSKYSKPYYTTSALMIDGVKQPERRSSLPSRDFLGSSTSPRIIFMDKGDDYVKVKWDWTAAQAGAILLFGAGFALYRPNKRGNSKTE